MSRDNLELAVWGDGTIRLAFWDTMNGDDIVLILNDDGTVVRSDYEGDTETQTPIEMVSFLRGLAKKWSNE